VGIYSNIVILSTSVLFAGDLWSARGRTACSLTPFVLQAVLPTKEGPSSPPSGPLSGRQQASKVNRSQPTGTVSQAGAATISDPPFLRHPIQFGPNSLELTVAGKDMLKRAADWLRQHREARILIVGSCDVGGSETCTHALAEARGAVVRKFLGSSGIASDQIVGVKGWDNLAQSCPASDISCRQFNRSARIFMASSVAP
jgi:outer membrane protein OmpA-like peptidoglycan-associated protein